MSNLAKCSRGFILIALTVQLPILIGLTAACLGLLAFNRTIDRKLAECIYTSLDESKEKPLKDLRNSEIKTGLFSIHVDEKVRQRSDTKKLNYLRFVFRGLNSFRKLSWQTNYICGAEVLCFNKKCRFKIIADKF